MFDRLFRLMIVGVLAAILVSATPRPVSAGPVGDAAAAVARWISEVEIWVQELFASLWSVMSYSEAGGDDGVLRRVMIVEPSVIAATAERAGFSLHRFELPIGGEGDLTLWMRFARTLAKEERATLELALERMVAPEDEARRQVLGLLLNAADWREIGESLGFSMTGVVIHANGSVRASLEYTSDVVTVAPSVGGTETNASEDATNTAPASASPPMDPRPGNSSPDDTSPDDTSQGAVTQKSVVPNSVTPNDAVPRNDAQGGSQPPTTDAPASSRTTR